MNKVVNINENFKTCKNCFDITNCTNKKVCYNYFREPNEVRPEDDERSAFRKIEDEITEEIRNYEYFKTAGLAINLFKHSEGGVESTCIMVMKGTKVLYKRMFEKYSDEVRYMCLFFLYRDIFNQGLMMMDRLAVEQEKLEKEMKVVDKVQSKSGIVGLDGKKL